MTMTQVPLVIRRHKLVSIVRNDIQNRNIIVGVSGGGDSIALLLLCVAASMQQSSTFKVIVGHINHGLRKEADEEQSHVESICDSLGIPCFTKKISVQAKNGSIAAGARDARYEALCGIARENNFSTIAVAHHADDQLETMLMALCRGSGARKLAGMASSRNLTDNIVLVRPLLHVEKKTLLDICTIASVGWCEDPTNTDQSTPRGRLRQEVIPVLRELWTSADRHAANGSTLLHAAIDVFESAIPTGTSWSRETLQQFPTSIVAAAMHNAIGNQATYETIESITRAIADDNTKPRSFVCSNGCTTNVTAHRVEVVYT